MNVNSWEIDQIDLNQMEDFSPEGIANALFRNNPKDPCSCQIISYESGKDMGYVFEILLIILMEGFSILTGGLEDMNLDELTLKHFTLLNPWFQSLGFNIDVKHFDFKNKEDYSDYYCKIMVKNSSNEIYFQMKNLVKNYHFVLNGDRLKEFEGCQDLNKLKCVFINGDNVFQIGFKMFYGTK